MRLGVLTLLVRSLPAALIIGASRSTRTQSLMRGALPGVSCVLSSPAEEPQAKISRGTMPSMEDSAAQTVYFVMGGPGSGKGTQCAKLVERYGMVHLSAGDLLRAEVASGSTLGLEISAIINQGQIVKSETTVALLRSAMAGKSGPFLIDGFPRSLENLDAFEAEMGPASFMLFLEVSEEEMESRLLKRGATSGRSDDNTEVIVKRFRTFLHDSMPVVDSLRKRDCVRVVNAAATEGEVFTRVCDAFSDQELEVVEEAAAAEATAAAQQPAAAAEDEPAGAAPNGFEWGGTF